MILCYVRFLDDEDGTPKAFEFEDQPHVGDTIIYSNKRYIVESREFDIDKRMLIVNISDVEELTETEE